MPRQLQHYDLKENRPTIRDLLSCLCQTLPALPAYDIAFIGSINACLVHQGFQSLIRQAQRQKFLKLAKVSSWDAIFGSHKNKGISLSVSMTPADDESLSLS
jgi:hypothetical protein